MTLAPACQLAFVIRHRAFLVVLALVSGCQAGEPIRVTNVQTGRSLNADNSVGTITTRFRPEDTMYASVITDGSGSATLAARWTYAGRLVNEASKDVRYHEQAATEFHLEPPGRFPTGDYQLEILFNGEVVETRALRVSP
jgi:hypothetical protein